MFVPGCVLLIAASVAAGAQEQPITIATGVPLYIRVTRTANLRVGAPVEGVLTAQLWVVDRQLLPKGAPVRGIVTRLEPVPKDEHVRALLNGDVTPLHLAVVNFYGVNLGGTEATLVTEGHARQTEMVRFVAQKKTSLTAKLKDLVHEKVQSAKDEVLAPGKKDRALRLLFNQLPYHPQRIWAGTDYVADLTQPATIEQPTQPAVAMVDDAALVGSLPTDAKVDGRLVTSINSDTARRGDRVAATVTRPLLDSKGRVLLPEGTELQGTVLRAKASKSFGRNGTLRFAFRAVQRPQEAPKTMYGTLTGTTGSEKQNLDVDAEGNVKAQPAKNRFAAPLLLAVLAARGSDDDGGAGQQVVAANGFGLVARIVSLTVNDRNVSVGFGVYGLAKSVYFRFVAKGHAVTFPKDTPVEVQLSGR